MNLFCQNVIAYLGWLFDFKSFCVLLDLLYFFCESEKITNKMNHYTNKTRMSGKIKHQENDQHSISPYYDYTPEDCNYMGFIFIYLTVLFVSGIILNTALLYKFVTIKSLRIPVNTFLAAILVCNLISIFFYLPITISSNYYCL